MIDSKLLIINVVISIFIIGICFTLYYFFGYKKFNNSINSLNKDLNDNLQKIQEQLRSNATKITSVEEQIKTNETQLELMANANASDTDEEDTTETFISTKVLKGCAEKQEQCKENISNYSNGYVDLNAFMKSGTIQPYENISKSCQ